MRSGSAALSATLSGLLNQAVRAAREQARRAMRDAVDPGLRAALSEDLSPPGDTAARFASQLTGRAVSAGSPDGKVTVAANGIGEITSVQFAVTALDGFDNLSLGEQVAAAASGALDAARSLQQRLLAGQYGDEAAVAAVLDARLAGFSRRMDELLDQLTQADRRISDLQ
jgi:DNA-binding protein YbaB